MRCLLSCCLVLCMGSLSAQTWKPLFNGRNLEGWKPLNGKARFEVKAGEIIGTTVSGEPNSFLATEKEYGDFILELEFFADSTMNSGIQFRSESRPDYLNGRVHGYQMEIDPSDRAWSGGIYDEGRRLWLYSLEYNPAAKTAYKRNGWNKYRIECIGHTVRTWVNGVPAAYLVDSMLTRGFIALQVHAIYQPGDAGRQIRWRNIRILETSKPSPSTTPIFVANLQANRISNEEARQGVRLLWDGQSTRGWRGAYKTSFPAKGWAMQDGILSVLPSGGGESVNGGDIVTEEKFSAFELQFDFRLTEGANSGVKYFVTEQENNAGSAIGLEYQVLDDARHPDAKMGTEGNRTLASLYDLIPSVKYGQANRDIGAWNRGMIRVHRDGRVEHFLNGYKVVEYQRGSQMYRALVARSKYAQWKDFGMAKEGRILLQDHGDRVDFRSIKVRKL